MANSTAPKLTVSDFIALTNQTLEYAFPQVQIEGEVSSFKVNQGKYVFFDLKDEGGSVGCFMTVWQLRVPIEDGMKVLITAMPKLTPWGKFSLTVQSVLPSGQGAIKKSFELLREKLSKEGLFAQERKRPLPYLPRRIGVVSSTQAAGYADFIKILNDRWGGLHIEVAHVQVQGAQAPDQIARAVKYFNGVDLLPDVIVVIRGGGSADDLAAFNDEPLVREIAASRVPTLVGIGHETDETLVDLVADVRAATPSNAAQLIVPHRREIIASAYQNVGRVLPKLDSAIEGITRDMRARLQAALQTSRYAAETQLGILQSSRAILAELDPYRVLARGYAIVRGDPRVGHLISVQTHKAVFTAEVKTYEET